MKLVLAITWMFSICTLDILCEQFSNNNVTFIDKRDLAVKSGTGDVALSRKKRSLLFPMPSTILLIFGVGTPLQLDDESVIIGVFLKFIYTLPQNSTDFTEPGVVFSRTSRSRWKIYKIVQDVLQIYGLGGKECILRAICEVASVPFNLRHGLFGQMLQKFLTRDEGLSELLKTFRPSSTNEDYDEYEDQEYHAAERLGKHLGENCHALYPECERNVLDVFSSVDS